jgi:chitinase
VLPEGSGSITPSGGTYSRNNYIQVTAAAVEGCRFDHWSGNLSGTQNPTNYRFDDANYTVAFVAHFVSDAGGVCEPPPPPPPPPAVPAQVVGYFPEWGVYHQPSYDVKSIVESGAVDGLTLINYAFVVPAPGANGAVVCQLDDPVAAYQQLYSSARSVAGSTDTLSSPLRGHFNQLRQLKYLHPELKVVASVGGWLGSTWFSDAAATAASRQAFVTSCLTLLVDGDLPVVNGAGGAGAGAGVFDGFDLDWEYPVAGGAQGTRHRSGDGANFTLLLQEFRRQFAARGRDDDGDDDLLLTMAGPASHYRAQNFRMSDDHPYLDLVYIMTYDFHGSWERTTGHQTNLCSSPDDPATETWRMSLDRSVKLYRDQYGVPAAKIVPGGAFYARGWKGVRGTNSGLYQRGSGAAPGKYEDGAQYFRDLPIDASGLATSGFTRYWDPKARAPWLFNALTGVFWSYDDQESVTLKGEYVRFHRLGGLMTWELSGDNLDGDLFDAMKLSLTAAPPESDPCGGV